MPLKEVHLYFKSLKTLLSNPPVLAIFIFNRMTEIRTDAISHAFGVVLMQRQDDVLYSFIQVKLMQHTLGIIISS